MKAQQMLALPHLPAEKLCHHEHDAAKTTEGWHKQTDNQPHQRHLPESPGMEAFFKDLFAKQKREVLDKIGEKQLWRKDLWKGDVDLSDWLKYMADGARPFVQTEYMAGLTDALVRLGASDKLSTWNVANPKVRDAINSWTMQFCETTNQTTESAIEEAIAQLKQALVDQLLSETNMVAQLVQRVNAIFTHAEEFRAKRIAITEASRALHLGQRLGALESGIVRGFRWLASADACEVCKDIMNENPEIDLGKAFAHIDDGPYGTILCPPAHPNCMCTMTEILGDVGGDR
jgi:hypothetical protein